MKYFGIVIPIFVIIYIIHFLYRRSSRNRQERPREERMNQQFFNRGFANNDWFDPQRQVMASHLMDYALFTSLCEQNRLSAIVNDLSSEELADLYNRLVHHFYASCVDFQTWIQSYQPIHNELEKTALVIADNFKEFFCDATADLFYLLTIYQAANHISSQEFSRVFLNPDLVSRINYNRNIYLGNRYASEIALFVDKIFDNWMREEVDGKFKQFGPNQLVLISNLLLGLVNIAESIGVCSQTLFKYQQQFFRSEYTHYRHAEDFHDAREQGNTSVGDDVQAALTFFNLPANANLEMIKKRYRELAKQYHPDINPTAGSGERMAQLNRYYDVLLEHY